VILIENQAYRSASSVPMSIKPEVAFSPAASRQRAGPAGGAPKDDLILAVNGIPARELGAGDLTLGSRARPAAASPCATNAQASPATRW